MAPHIKEVDVPAATLLQESDPGKTLLPAVAVDVEQVQGEQGLLLQVDQGVIKFYFRIIEMINLSFANYSNICQKISKYFVRSSL